MRFAPRPGAPGRGAFMIPEAPRAYLDRPGGRVAAIRPVRVDSSPLSHVPAGFRPRGRAGHLASRSGAALV